MVKQGMVNCSFEVKIRALWKLLKKLFLIFSITICNLLMASKFIKASIKITRELYESFIKMKGSCV